MPIYDYSCKECGYSGEHLVQNSLTQMKCPNGCEGVLEKKISGFSIGKSNSGSVNNSNYPYPEEVLKKMYAKDAKIPVSEVASAKPFGKLIVPCSCGGVQAAEVILIEKRDPARN